MSVRGITGLFLSWLSATALAHDFHQTPSEPSEPAGEQLCATFKESFSPFYDEVAVQCRQGFGVVSSDGFPNHEMMNGIRQSNHQLPLPQKYTWHIPLKPEYQKTTTATFDGPIAVAVNGVPIFDPSKQGGKGNTMTAGELDQCNGHAGRADDYHYHGAPVCILDNLAPGQPLGWALDGFAIYGFETGGKLDSCNGEFSETGQYHYHVTEGFPYVLGCFHGEIKRNLQPKTKPIRPMPTMRPAKVTNMSFTETKDGWFQLSYSNRQSGQQHTIAYRKTTSDCYQFKFNQADQAIVYCPSTRPKKRK